MGKLGERVGIFEALGFSTIVSIVIGLTVLLVVRQSLAIPAKLCLTTSRTVRPMTIETIVEKPSASKIPTRSPSLPITAACTDPASPAERARTTASAFPLDTAQL